MIHSRIKHLVIKCKSIPDRVIYTVLKLNNTCNIQIIQAYAPTSTSIDENIEQFYEDLSAAKNAKHAKFTVVTEDFNAKLGQKEETDPANIGFGLGTKNNRGRMLFDFLREEQMYCMNTFFKKSLKRK